MLPTLEKAWHEATLLFETHQSPSPRIDACVLLCHVIDKPSSYLYTWPERTLSNEELAAFELLIERRKEGEPVAYILGYRDFWSLRLRVDPSTLIPRPDTECLVEFALARLGLSKRSGKRAGKREDKEESKARVLDLGAGTGAIALAIAFERPDLDVLGVDLREEAVALAKRNALDNGVENAHFIQSSWFDKVPPQRFSMIVSNPPYIDPNDPHLLQGDVRFEPKSALVAEENGLADIRHICQHCRPFLENGGWLLIEHGHNQGEAVRGLFLEARMCDVETLKDYSGHDRVTLGRVTH